MSDEMKILSGNVQQLTERKTCTLWEGLEIIEKKWRENLSKEFDHEGTRNLVCPYCGYADVNSWELSDSEDRHMCGNCGKEFGFERVVYCEYTSWFIEEK